MALWMGGLVALGAIAAPAVFGIVPMPASADAMTLVFRRFDRLAIGCAGVAMTCEAILALRSGPMRGLDVARAAAVVLGAALAIGQGVWLSPAIDALHRSGAVRGLGDAGLALERTHRFAETSGKAQLLLLLFALPLVVLKVARTGQLADQAR